MPRTPLLRALERLARAHQRAERRGIARAELRERRAYTRRDVIKRRGALGAALAVGPSVLARPAMAARAPRVAIVGAGIAGLNAALTLQDKGIAATLYEAADHVGGRMHSDRSGYF